MHPSMPSTDSTPSRKPSFIILAGAGLPCWLPDILALYSGRPTDGVCPRDQTGCSSHSDSFYSLPTEHRQAPREHSPSPLRCVSPNETDISFLPVSWFDLRKDLGDRPSRKNYFSRDEEMISALINLNKGPVWTGRGVA